MATIFPGRAYRGHCQICGGEFDLQRSRYVAVPRANKWLDQDFAIPRHAHSKEMLVSYSEAAVWQEKGFDYKNWCPGSGLLPIELYDGANSLFMLDLQEILKTSQEKVRNNRIPKSYLDSLGRAPQPSDYTHYWQIIEQHQKNIEDAIIVVKRVLQWAFKPSEGLKYLAEYEKPPPYGYRVQPLNKSADKGHAGKWRSAETKYHGGYNFFGIDQDVLGCAVKREKYDISDDLKQLAYRRIHQYSSCDDTFFTQELSSYPNYSQFIGALVHA